MFKNFDILCFFILIKMNPVVVIINPILYPFGDSKPRFTKEEIADITEWYNENAKPQLVINEAEPIDAITVEDLERFLDLKKYHRRHFHYPTYAEVMNEVENLKMGTLRMLTLEQFLFVLDKFVLKPEIRHELLQAFRVFDTEKRGFLDADELRGIVSNYGDVLNELEVEEMLRDADVRGDGNVFYEDFVDSMFALAPELYELKTDFLYDDPDEDPSLPPLPEPEVVEAPPPPPPPPPPAKGKDKKKKK